MVTDAVTGAKLDLTKINQTAMADAVGVSIPLINRIIYRRQRPSLWVARLMAKYLGVSMEELCDIIGTYKRGDPYP